MKLYYDKYFRNTGDYYMHVLYRITYLPHLNTDKPKYYIGSKYNWSIKRPYFGSVASGRMTEYSFGLSLKKWWKEQVKSDPNAFLFEILESFDCISTLELVERERKLQIKLDVVNSNEYFNSSLAAENFVSQPKTEYTKQLLSEKTKAYWDSELGAEKKLRLSKRNKLYKSNELKWRWANPTEAMLNKHISGRPLGSKNKKPYKRSERKIIAGDMTFINAKLAAEYFGIHPINIRLYCRENRTVNNITWRYD